MTHFTLPAMVTGPGSSTGLKMGQSEAVNVGFCGKHQKGSSGDHFVTFKNIVSACCTSGTNSVKSNTGRLCFKLKNKVWKCILP